MIADFMVGTLFGIIVGVIISIALLYFYMERHSLSLLLVNEKQRQEVDDWEKVTK